MIVSKMHNHSFGKPIGYIFEADSKLHFGKRVIIYIYSPLYSWKFHNLNPLIVVISSADTSL